MSKTNKITFRKVQIIIDIDFECQILALYLGPIIMSTSIPRIHKIIFIENVDFWPIIQNPTNFDQKKRNKLTPLNLLSLLSL